MSADLSTSLTDEDAISECTDISETECGCKVSYRPGNDRTVGLGEYSVTGNEVTLRDLQVIEGYGEPQTAPQTSLFCRSGNTLAIQINLAVNIRQASR